MKIKHRIGITVDINQLKILNRIGIIDSNFKGSFLLIELYEDDSRYGFFKKYIEEWDLPDIVETEFTDDELNNASLLIYNYTWSNGYPQPEDNFQYKDTTYKKDNYCKSCGVGLVQQEPFRIRKEPVWKNKKIFDLNWVFDEIFVSTDAYRSIFMPFGIGFKEVRLFKTDTVIQNTVQLDIPTTTEEINLISQPYQICKSCGEKKYSPQIKGALSGLTASVGQLHCFKSREYFGSATNAHKKIFISQKLRQEIIKHKIKTKFIPIES